MDFKLVSKNNIGTVVLLLLVIALSQAKTFELLIDTALGRTFLILFILYLSYCNKILGVICVLFIIIMFNGNIYHEGATTMTLSGPGQVTMPTPVPAPEPEPVKIISNPSQRPETIPFQESVLTKLQDQMRLLDTNLIVTNSKIEEAKLKAKTGAAEGFDILGIENNIKRGKQSNSIQVNNLTRESIFISPYNESSFFENYGFF